VTRIHPSYRGAIAAEVKDTVLDPLLVEAVVLTESSGKPMAYRFEPAFWTKYLAQHPNYRHMIPEIASASYGLMQIMFSTACQEGYVGKAWGLFDPNVNIHFGVRHLLRHLAWSQDQSTTDTFEEELASALACYNGGRFGNVPGDGKEDRNAAYARKVLTTYAALRAANET
jgi:soluble lytic murein transglycosylase-like protein